MRYLGLVRAIALHYDCLRSPPLIRPKRFAAWLTDVVNGTPVDVGLICCVALRAIAEVSRAQWRARAVRHVTSYSSGVTSGAADCDRCSSRSRHEHSRVFHAVVHKGGIPEMRPHHCSSVDFVVGLQSPVRVKAEWQT